MPGEELGTKTVDQLTQAEMEEFLGVHPEGVLKVGAEEWKKDWKDGVEANADRWKRRTEGTKKDIVALSIAAEGKFANKMKEVISSGARAKALGRTNTAAVLAQVAATPSSDYSSGATKRAGKFGVQIDAQYALREYAVVAINKMPQDDKAQRGKRMLAARDTNLIIGQFLGGIIDLSTAKSQIDAACK